MASFLDLLPNDFQTLFGVCQILRPELLAMARQTAFTWSAQPGTVCLAVNRRYFDMAAANPNVAAIICPRSAIGAGPPSDKSLVVAERADELFYSVHNLGIHAHAAAPADAGRRWQIHPGAVIAPTARLLGDRIGIGEGTSIGEYCVIESPAVIGAGCALHAGTLVGTDGLFSKTVLGRKIHIRHFGGVRVGDGCIIHAGTNVSRSVNFNECTELAEGVHVGIGANIGHDSRIGRGTEISGRVMLAGRVNVGEGCWIGAGAVISNAVRIGDRAKIRIGSVVVDDLAPGADVSGNFASDHTARLRQYAIARRR
jgi:UDP-3-O-[3-hydroxymyristoyl] glucosamine N-acyltransferase